MKAIQPHLLGHAVEVVAGDQPAGARHISRNERGLARNVAAEELRDQSHLPVDAAARRLAGEERDGLAPVDSEMYLRDPSTAPRVSSFRVLSNGQQVEIGIVKPGDFRSSRRGPDAARVLDEEGVALKDDALRRKRVDDNLDVVDSKS
jgi:hypothetical protein